MGQVKSPGAHIVDQNAVDKDRRRQPLNRLKFDIRSSLLDFIIIYLTTLL